MNLEEAIEIISNRGDKVFSIGDGIYLIEFNNKASYTCSARKLIQLARNYSSMDNSMGVHESNKMTPGPGGFNCSCCRLGTKKESKTYTHRLERRKEKQKKYLDDYDDSNMVDVSK